MKAPTLLNDAKRAKIYQYGKDGKITISKRFLQNATDELDLVEAIENGDIEVENVSDCTSTMLINDLIVDMDALSAIDMILSC